MRNPNSILLLLKPRMRLIQVLGSVEIGVWVGKELELELELEREWGQERVSKEV